MKRFSLLNTLDHTIGNSVDIFETSGLGKLTEGDMLACEGMIITNELKVL